MIAVLDCPSLAFLPHLIAHPQWSAVRQAVTQPGGTGCFVHLASAEVVAEAAYAQFVTSFGPSVTHYVINSQVCPWQTAFCKSAASVAKRSLLDSVTFPIPLSSAAPAQSLPGT